MMMNLIGGLSISSIILFGVISRRVGQGQGIVLGKGGDIMLGEWTKEI